jgi:hypothetical protein
MEDPASLRAVAASVDADPAWTARLAAAGPRTDAAAMTLASFLDPPPPPSGDPADPEAVFLDPASRAVANGLGQWLDGEPDADPPGAGAIMDTVGDEAVRAAVAALHFDGEKLAASAFEPGAPAIQSALEALVALLERNRSNHAVRRARMDAAAGEMSGADLAALVEVRRREGNRPAAIARRPAPLTPGRTGRGFSGPRRPS